jgi:hypothetical protein
MEMEMVCIVEFVLGCGCGVGFSWFLFSRSIAGML